MKYQVTRRARLLAGAAFGAIGILMGAGAASAQETPQDDAEAQEIDEVIVTGIRASIQSSIAAKRNNTSIVEVVTAEDIGKLPDVSIAESLARLPGLTAQRLDADPDGRLQLPVALGVVVQELAPHKALERGQ
jgi:iron complex outermembrane receptor protein